MAITVKMARVGVNKTQQEISEILGMHVQTYANLEKFPERFTIAQAERFAKIVGRDVSDIIFLSENSN